MKSLRKTLSQNKKSFLFLESLHFDESQSATLEKENILTPAQELNRFDEFLVEAPHTVEMQKTVISSLDTQFYQSERQEFHNEKRSFQDKIRAFENSVSLSMPPVSTRIDAWEVKEIKFNPEEVLFDGETLQKNVDVTDIQNASALLGADMQSLSQELSLITKNYSDLQTEINEIKHPKKAGDKLKYFLSATAKTVASPITAWCTAKGIHIPPPSKKQLDAINEKKRILQNQFEEKKTCY